MALHVQPATLADLPGVVQLMNAAFRGTGTDAGWTTESAYIQGDRTTEAILRKDLADAPNGSLLLVKDDAEMPFASVWLKPLSPQVWYLGSLTVRASLQNTGIGRELLAAAEAWASSRGARTVRISVIQIRDSLIAWYERRGYRRTGETQPFPYGDPRVGTPLRQDLHFVVLEKELDANPA